MVVKFYLNARGHFVNMDIDVVLKKTSHLSLLLTAGVADEDMLDEFLVGRHQLDHGQSSTMDVRRYVDFFYISG